MDPVDNLWHPADSPLDLNDSPLQLDPNDSLVNSAACTQDVLPIFQLPSNFKYGNSTGTSANSGSNKALQLLAASRRQ